jgi:hypothetical protein
MIASIFFIASHRSPWQLRHGRPPGGSRVTNVATGTIARRVPNDKNDINDKESGENAVRIVDSLAGKMPKKQARDQKAVFFYALRSRER